MATILGMALGCLKQVKKLDIMISSQGDVPYLVYSLQKASEAGFQGSTDWKIVMSMSAISKIDPMWRPALISANRPSAHLLVCDPAVMPSKRTAADLEKSDHEWLPSVACEGYTLQALVWGKYAWRKPKSAMTQDELLDAATEAQHTKAFTDVAIPNVQHYVLTWKPCVRLDAIVTTLLDYSLIGTEREQGKQIYKSVTMRRFASPSDWYDFVVDSNYMMNSSFLNARSHYNAISNLICPPTKGVRYVLGEHGEWVEGTKLTSGGAYYDDDAETEDAKGSLAPLPQSFFDRERVVPEKTIQGLSPLSRSVEVVGESEEVVGAFGGLLPDRFKFAEEGGRKSSSVPKAGVIPMVPKKAVEEKSATVISPPPTDTTAVGADGTPIQLQLTAPPPSMADFM